MAEARAHIGLLIPDLAPHAEQDGAQVRNEMIIHKAHPAHYPKDVIVRTPLQPAVITGPANS
jgi:hypothetical protein